MSFNTTRPIRSGALAARSIAIKPPRDVPTKLAPSDLPFVHRGQDVCELLPDGVGFRARMLGASTAAQREGNHALRDVVAGDERPAPRRRSRVRCGSIREDRSPSPRSREARTRRHGGAPPSLVVAVRSRLNLASSVRACIGAARSIRPCRATHRRTLKHRECPRPRPRSFGR